MRRLGRKANRTLAVRAGPPDSRKWRKTASAAIDMSGKLSRKYRLKTRAQSEVSPPSSLMTRSWKLSAMG